MKSTSEIRTFDKDQFVNFELKYPNNHNSGNGYSPINSSQDTMVLNLRNSWKFSSVYDASNPINTIRETEFEESL
jgi:hypothetical protein